MQFLAYGWVGRPENRGPKKGTKMDPKMSPTTDPKWNTSGHPKKSKIIGFPCVFAQNGGPEGARCGPKNGLGNDPKLGPTPGQN